MTAAEIWAAYAGYDTDIATYNSEVAVVEENNAKIREPNWWETLFGVEFNDRMDYPAYIGEYDGATFETAMTAGGYGLPTSGIYDVVTAKYKPFGQFAQYVDATEKSIDIDTTSCTPRTVVLTAYVPNGGTAPGALTINLKSVALQTAAMAPSAAPPNPQGASGLT